MRIGASLTTGMMLSILIPHRASTMDSVRRHTLLVKHEVRPFKRRVVLTATIVKDHPWIKRLSDTEGLQDHTVDPSEKGFQSRQFDGR